MGAVTTIVSTLLHRIHSILTLILLQILSLGPKPRHVGFVMDGNRRYARGRGMQVAQGHSDGFSSLRRTLEVCLRLRIRVVSIYAFSIDNFAREQREVDALMRLAKTKLAELCQHGDLLQKHGVRIRFVGRMDLLPEDVREAMLDMQKQTAHHRNGVLNVCSPYTSREEITMAVQDTVKDVQAGRLDNSDISSQTLFSRLGTSRNISSIKSDSGRPLSEELEGGKLDILVRTSNVKRLSDFMMWQASDDTQLHFVRTNWPDFGLTDILPILLGWQQKVWLRSLGY